MFSAVLISCSDEASSLKKMLVLGTYKRKLNYCEQSEGEFIELIDSNRYVHIYFTKNKTLRDTANYDFQQYANGSANIDLKNFKIYCDISVQSNEGDIKNFSCDYKIDDVPVIIFWPEGTGWNFYLVKEEKKKNI